MTKQYFPADDVEAIAGRLKASTDRPPFSEANQAVLVAMLESLLVTIENGNRARLQLPARLNRFPFTLGRVQRLILRLHDMLLRDQRQLNNLVVQAIGLSMRLGTMQNAEVAALRDRVAELEQRLGAPGPVFPTQPGAASPLSALERH